MSRLCRGDFSRVRRVIADTQRSAPTVVDRANMAGAKEKFAP